MERGRFMDVFKLADNIARLRRRRQITQEELADYLGVTKAAVSKWENRQTTPDILLLPQLAGFFGVTIDELMGYEAQLSGEQIRRLYRELCDDFVRHPFPEAMGRVRSLVHRYYSCYPFLVQVCTLYLNHFMLAENEEESRRILQEAAALCDRVVQNSKDVGVCTEAVAMRAMLDLQQGHALEAIDALEPTLRSRHVYGQGEAVLVQAYCMAGQMERARSHAQVQQYTDLLGLVGDATQLLALYESDPERCREIMRRAQGVMELFALEQLHPNLAAQYYYQAALVYAAVAEKEKALEMLEGFEACGGRLLAGEEMLLKGDGYFDRIEEWIEQLPLGGTAPRDRAFVKQNMLEALGHPAFGPLEGMAAFQQMKRRMTGGCGT